MEDKKPETNTLNLIESAKSVIVVLPPDPGKDLVSAAVNLHLALKEAGKTSQIGCGSEVHLDNSLGGISEISDTIGSRNLIISFDYKEDDLDKVDYDVRDDGKFYLLVKPKPGSPVPDLGGVKYSYSGADSDLVITLGINSLEELGKIYADEKKFLDDVATVSLNISLRPSAFTGNAYHKNLNSFSELVTSLIEELKLKLTPPTAQNLLVGIYDSTNNLTDGRLTADTFSAVAFLMRAGAHLPGNKNVNQPQFSQPPFFEIPDATTDEAIPLPEEETAPVPSDWSKPKIFRVGDKQDAS